MKQIELKNVSKIYQSGDVKVKAIDNVNLDIQKGDFIAITGPSGSGKSTLMYIVGALTRPSLGSYRFEDEEISKMSQKRLADSRKRNFGFVFQNFNLIPRISTLANVELPMVYKRIPSKERRKEAYELLKKVNLEKRASFKPNQLSGGEMQRAAIARALANRPDVILADEPTGNLDTKSGNEVMEIFKSLNKEGITIILVTHDREKAQISNRIIKLKDGMIEGVENVS